MLIAIDASTISTQGGPRTYVLGLLDALLSIDKENEYILFYNDPSHMGRFPMAKEIVIKGKNPVARLWREHILVPCACKREKVDILHCTKSAIPFFSVCPTVVTLHDLIPLKHPETEKLGARVYWKMHIPHAVKKSDFIITISEHAKKEIIDDYNISPDKIKIIALGFNPAMSLPRESEKGDKIRLKYGLPEKYILYVGTIQPRKNISTLIEAYAKLKSRRDAMPKLVITGRKGWLYEKLFKRIEELGLKDDIIFTGFLPDDELPYIYDNALLFAYLSLFEGFGLPPLEAMACGIPVIVSDSTSMPEVVGDAGIKLPPKDIEGVAAAIEKILDNPEYAKKLGEAGRERSKLFSWEFTARETLKVYKEVFQKFGKVKR
ncbi:MAG: glycosyltransferase family 4 protein [Desulfuromonadales bacterium]|nr:glycosyltransferase family 4 protein [Desulfuromonadales bacterium]